MSELSLALMGSFVATLDGRVLTHFRAKTAQALLIYLACQTEAHQREPLMTLLWPGMPQPSAQQSLRQSLYLLRQVISELPAKSGNGVVPLLLADRQMVQMNPDGRYHLDVHTFTHLLKQDETQWPEAVALYRGDFLADFYLPDSAPFEEWANTRRADLRRRCLDALSTLTDRALQASSLAEAGDYARQQLAIDNLREGAYRQLMLSLARSGQRSEALAEYESCRRLLRAELAVEPTAETQALYTRLVNDEEALLPLTSVALSPPQPVKNSPRHNLPQRLTSFIGRQTEIAHLQKQLLNPANRLVTLTGPGGTGKTRLSLEAAGTLLDGFTDGIWLVELAPLADPAFVLNAVAAVFELREEGERPLATVVNDYLQAKQLLLILDNCEHLIESCARLAESWLETCPRLTILASSREALGVPGETAVRIPPLAVPDPHETPSLEILAQVEAVRLFVERGRAALPDFGLTEQNGTAVTQVCQRLDGIPLALELAAARVKLLPVEQVARRLDDRFRLLTGGSRTALPRQQTLRATLDWSYDLLPEPEQHLLQRLSVFAGGWTLEAAEAVCADDADGGTVGPVLSKVEARPATAEGVISDDEILDLLTQLVNKSLVLAEREPGQESRYRLLETIRQYAQEKLLQTGSGETFRNRHLDYFLQLAETAEPELHRANQLLWLNRLEAENDNLHTALAWSLENPNEDVKAGLRLATALVEFWRMRSTFGEGSRWLDVALEKGNSAARPVRARLLLNAGWFWGLRLSDRMALLQESEALYRQQDDKRGVAGCLSALGFYAQSEGELDVATSLLSEGLTLARQFDDKQLLTGLYHGLAYVALKRGDFVQVTELAARGLALVQETGDRDMKLHLLHIQGRSAHVQRNHARARAFFYEALALSRELKYRSKEGITLNSLGEMARFEGAYAEAVAFYHQSLSLAREVGDMPTVAIILNNLGLVALGQGDRPRATSLFRESLALAQEMKLKAHSLWSVWGLASVALAEGQTQRAAQLFATDGLLADIKSEEPVDFDDYERDVALARTQLGEEGFAAAWAAGQAMSLEEAVAYALEETS